MAKQGQMDAVKIMAKDLVRTRRYVKKFMLMRANAWGKTDADNAASDAGETDIMARFSNVAPTVP